MGIIASQLVQLPVGLELNLVHLFDSLQVRDCHFLFE